MTTAQRAALGVAFEIKAIDEQTRTFSGLAATWEKDLGDDVIHHGAFARTLDHWRTAKKSRPVPLLNGHSRFSVGDVLGKMSAGSETAEGLEATFELVPDDPETDAAMRRVKGGFITGLSIGYTPIRWEYEQIDGGKSWDRIRHLHEVKLHEISLVVFPMNDGARVDPNSVKALLDAARAGTLTDEEKAELTALLTAPPGDPPPEPKGLAPDDPKRLEREALFRAVKLQGLATA